MLSEIILFAAIEAIKISDVAPDKTAKKWDDPEDDDQAPTKIRKRKAPASNKGKEKRKRTFSKKNILPRNAFSFRVIIKKAPSAKVIFWYFFYLFDRHHSSFFFFQSGTNKISSNSPSVNPTET